VPGDPRLRASDADRERTVQLLREHHAEGRLDMEEFHERLNAAYEAKTIGDLDEILADLPGIDLYRLPSAALRPAPPGTGGWQPARRPGGSVVRQAGQWGAWTAASSVLVVTWLVVGAVSGGFAWLPWFLLIIIPWAIAISRRA
jgi:Domain of unknown function (DUF1707)